MISLRRPEAGVYANGRYRTGLKAYRRRMRAPLLVAVVPMVVFFCAVSLTHKLDPWSVAAAAVLSSAIGLAVFVRDEPPQHVLNWRRGAEGERKTERALRPLLRKGWRIEHDLQRVGRGNIDHVVYGPPGTFLLETKNLSGTIAVEDGCLVARRFDDPDDVSRYGHLPARLGGQAKEISGRIRAETGRGFWVTTVVVVWGHFPQGFVEHGTVTYVAGDRLRSWLESR